MSLTKVSFSMITGAPVNVKDFGAVGNGVIDDTDAIKAALAAADSVYFPLGTYIVSSTIQIQKAIQIDGEPGTAIKAKTGFTGINVTKDSAPYVLKAIFAIFVGSTINTLIGPRIGEETLPISVSNIQLLGNNNAVDYCLYIERCPGARIFGVHTYSGVNGIFFGPYCWGLQCMNFRIFGASNIALNLGTASNGVLINNFEIWGGADVTTSVGIQSNNDNYGVAIIGGYIEKGVTGIYIVGNAGPHYISGIDFEIFSQHAVRIDAPSSQTYGPITIEASFLQSSGAMIYNANAYVILRGNIFRAGAAWTGQHCISTTNNAIFEVVENRYADVSGNVIAPNFTGSTSLTSTQSTGSLWAFTNRRDTEPSGAYDSNYGIYNYSSVDEPEILSGSIEFQNSRQGNPGAVYSSRWKLIANETWLNGATPEVKYTAGVYLSPLGGAKSFTPIENNTHTLGNATYRWSEVYATNGTINTSDANQKQQIRLLTDAEQAVAVRLKSLIKAFKFNDAVQAKGDAARIHIGVIAQDVEAAFAAESLDADNYGLFCRDTLADGSVVLGIRYEELLAFIITAL